MVSAMDKQRQRLNRRILRSLERGVNLLTKGKRASLTISRIRMGLVLGCVAVCAVLFNVEWFVTGNWVLAGCLAGFLVLVHVHNRLKDRLHRLRVWLLVQTRHLACLRLEWTILPETEITLASDHPYGPDLDVVGPQSLLRLLDVTVSREGRNRLIDWMANQNTTPPSYDEWQRRQTLVRTLTPLQGLRTRLQLAAACVSRQPINGERVTQLLQEPLPVSRVVPLLVTAGGLAAFNLFLFLFWAVGGGPAYWILSFLVYALVTWLAGGRLRHVFERTLDLHVELKKLGVVIGILEKRSFSRLPALQTLTEPLRKGKGQPSVAIAQLAGVCSGLSVKGHPIIHVALNLVVPWDLAWTWLLQNVRGRLRPLLPDWMDRLATIDAAASLATFAFLNPSYTWPIRTSDENASEVGLVGTSIGHPLLAHAERVGNDLTLKGLGRILLVTGSNMSGKSTLLRTIGINVCLAQAGGPVCAERWEWSWMRMYSCLRVGDDLGEGLSSFYAEVKRLKRLLVAMEDHGQPPVLFLIDEIFKGTNNRERLAGSEAFIRALTAGRGLGLVTTHDLQLTGLERDAHGITNVHFQETVGENALTFDYRLRPGPCPTTNALRIMAMEGLPVPEGTDGRWSR